MPIDAAWSVLKAVAGQPTFPVTHHSHPTRGLDAMEGFKPRSIAGLPTPLNYYGGKGWLVPQLRELYEPFRDTHSFHDVFGGSGAAIMGVNPKRGSWNDTSSPLVNFQRHLKRGLTIPNFGPNTKDNYKQLKDRYNHLQMTDPHSVEAAQLYFALNRRGHSGLMEHNKQGRLMSSGGHGNPNLERAFDLTSYKRPMHRWKIDNRDFRDVMRGLGRNSFGYIDPPYPKRQGQYGQGGFGDELQTAVRDAALAHPGPVVVSNYATPEMLELYQDDFDIETKTPRQGMLGANKRITQQIPEMIARRIDE